MRDSFLMYTANMDQISLLTMEQRGILFTSIMCYAAGRPLPDMDGMTQMAFCFIKAQMDRDSEKYQKTVEARREAGKLGGRPKGNGSAEKQEEAKKANGFPEKQAEAKKHDNDNVYVNDNDTVKDKNYCVRFEQIWKAYPRKKEKAAAYKAYKARLSNGFSEDELETAVKRYAEECKRLRRDKQYIKHAATFLGPNTPFEDYLKGETDGPVAGNDSPDTGRAGKTYNDDSLGGVGAEFEGF